MAKIDSCITFLNFWQPLFDKISISYSKLPSSVTSINQISASYVIVLLIYCQLPIFIVFKIRTSLYCRNIGKTQFEKNHEIFSNGRQIDGIGSVPLLVAELYKKSGDYYI